MAGTKRAQSGSPRDSDKQSSGKKGKSIDRSFHSSEQPENDFWSLPQLRDGEADENGDILWERLRLEAAELFNPTSQFAQQSKTATLEMRSRGDTTYQSFPFLPSSTYNIQTEATQVGEHNAHTALEALEERVIPNHDEFSESLVRLAQPEPILIPRTKPQQYIFPDQDHCLSPAHWHRFREVELWFQRAVQNDRGVASSTSFIIYLHRMCGASPSSAAPTILVACRQRERPALQKLFLRRELRKQYYAEEPAIKVNFTSLLSSRLQPGQQSTMTTPRFKLLFWEVSLPVTLLVPPVAGIPLHVLRPGINAGFSTSDVGSSSVIQTFSMCGSVILTSGDSTKDATATCSIEIDGALYGLTVRHLIRNINSAISTGSPSEPSRFENLDSSDSDDSFVDPIEYIDSPGLEEAEISYTRKQTVHDDDDDYDGSEDELEEEELPTEPLSISMIDSAAQLQNLPDLDWALFQLNNTEAVGHNTFIAKDYEIRAICGYETSPPTTAREVLIITRDQNSEPVSAILEPGFSVVNVGGPSSAARVWSASLLKHKGLYTGDSGSLVVDAASYSMYGHVVGVSPWGEVFISPFCDVLDQLRLCFPEKEITLLDSTKPSIQPPVVDNAITRIYKNVNEERNHPPSLKPLVADPGLDDWLTVPVKTVGYINNVPRAQLSVWEYQQAASKRILMSIAHLKEFAGSLDETSSLLWVVEILRTSASRRQWETVQMLLCKIPTIEDYTRGSTMDGPKWANLASSWVIEGEVYLLMLHKALASQPAPFLKHILAQDFSFAAQDGQFANALQTASFRGHDAIVNSLLLDFDVDVNEKGGEYGSALQAAAYAGHLSIVEILINASADVNSTEGKHGSALRAARSQGHNAVVTLLLQHDALDLEPKKET